MQVAWPRVIVVDVVVLDKLKKNFFDVYLFLRERETECEQGRGTERGRHRI